MRFLKKKFLLFVLLFLLIGSVVFILLSFPNILRDLSLYLYWFHPSEENLQNYISQTQSSSYKSWLLNNHQIEVKSENLNEIYTSISKSSEIANINLTPVSYAVSVDFEVLNETDSEFIKDSSFTLEGIKGSHNYAYKKLALTNNSEENIKPIEVKYFFEEPVAEIKISGEKEIEEVKTLIEEKFNKTLEILGNENLEKLSQYFIKEDFKGVDLAEKLEGLSFKNFNVNVKDEGNNRLQGFVDVGNVSFYLNNCKKEKSLEVVYDFNKEGYFFNSEINFVNSLCKKLYVEVAGKLIGTCVDCTLYPVDKNYGLREDYTPPVSPISFAVGGFSIATSAYADFEEMFYAALSAGHSINIVSSYRSFYDQAATFEAWTQFEMSNGNDRATAEIIANSYSARPGFSEHQLGTTLDLNSLYCGGFTAYCESSQYLWSWLKENAYKYGFAHSYPQGFEAQTGYIFEPWHYRWIGKELALEFKQRENEIWLSEFLREKERY